MIKAEIPTLEKLCQEVLADEATKYGSKKINELCKRIPSHLLEHILQSLLDRNQVTDVALNMFLVPSRTNLVMNGFCKIKNSTLKQIGFCCPHLLSLNLSDCVQLSNTVVRAVLQGCPVLEDLRLDRCHRVTDAAFDVNQSPFQSLIGLLSLQTISLQGCPQVTGSIVTTLNKCCSRLKYLNLSQCNQMESGAIKQLFEHSRLLHLNLSFVDEVTDEAFLTLPNFAANANRTLSPTWSWRKSAIALDDGAHKSRLAGQDASKLSHNKVKQSHRCSPIQVLQLAKSRITDKSMLRMEFLADLVEIHLQWCSGITDAGIAALVTGCPKLEVVDLKSCSISDLSIEAIAQGSKELRSLDVSWCSNITDSGVRGLSAPHTHGSQVPSLTTSRPTEDSSPAAADPLVSTAVSSQPFHTAVSSEESRGEMHSNGDSDSASFLGAAVGTNGITNRTNNSDSGSRSSSDSINGHRILPVGEYARNNSLTFVVDPDENPEAVYPRKLEMLVLVWCLQLTDAALLSLAGLPKLKTVEATGCTGVSETSVQHLRTLGIKVVM